MRLEPDIISKQNTLKSTHQLKIVLKVAADFQKEGKKIIEF